MDIRDLVYFETIARLGHLGRAAVEVGRTKPALSKCIRRLEEHVKAPLFERRGRRLALTEPGRTLLEHARRMRVSMADALRHTAEQAAGERGHIRIGLGTSIVEAMLPALAGWYREESAGISLAVQVGLNDALRRELADDQLDGIITTALREDESQFERQDWVEDDVVVVARAGHALDQSGSVDMRNMARFDWVLTGAAIASRQWLDAAFVARSFAPPNVRVEIGSAQLVAAFVEKSDMLSFVPRRSLRQGRLGTGLVELRCRYTTMRRTLCFLCRKGGYVSPALKRLTERLRAAILEDQAARPASTDRKGTVPASKRSAPPSRSRARP
ncbi:Transcriptional regulator, LysR family [Bradyrhizobium sp. STM 3843]|uniref:LysR family transcriptional regulator n=1 Tax=Bradyrhizobium sp. STM 3843 TaxID=551947 RepID=UPI0002403483|nr:LysR family transcriptional regulator [Bradyrhizobium sp. STM 3843]CCE10763.1 Transcriptional regulator, LysR family [Bradyrhizobium sp. STM 3843]